MAKRPVVALVGGESLLGREIRDLVGGTGGGFELRLMAGDEEQSGTLTRVGDEPALVTALSAESLEDARAIILAGSAESSRQALELAAAETGAAIIDLTGAAEELPDARLRAPLAEPEDQLAGRLHAHSRHRPSGGHRPGALSAPAAQRTTPSAAR